MPSPAKPTSDELFASLLRGPCDDEVAREIERVLTMTPEERRRELVAAGYDPDELRAGLDAWLVRTKQADSD